jgi:hypothetical protein
MRLLLSAFCLLTGVVGAVEVTDDFSSGMGQWEPLRANHWAVREEGGNARLVLTKPDKMRPPLRRPSQYALLKGSPWWDVTIDVAVKTLRPDKVTGRDVCVVFGYRDDTHFYYAHVCSDSNGGTHNVIMKVDGKKRGTIMREKRPPARLTAAWQTVRVTHQADGEIKVYVDDMDAPLMTGKDTSFPVGRVGVASFDDPAMFDDVKVSGHRLDEDPGMERVSLFETGPITEEWRRTVPVPEGDGNVVCEVEARLMPGTEQPNGWWHFAEYQDSEGHYLTGAYGSEPLTGEVKTYTSRAYIPTGAGQVRVGVGRDGGPLADVRAFRLWQERPKIELVEPLAGAKLADSTPRFAWVSTSDRVTVEVAAGPDFADAQTVAVENTNLLAWPKPLAPGTWYWRVRNVDGVVAPARYFEQTADLSVDTTDPQIAVDSSFVAEATGSLPIALLDGETAEGMYVEATIDGLQAQVSPTATGWSVQPTKSWGQGLNRVIVRAIDAAGNGVEKRAYVTHISPVPAKAVWTMDEGVRIEGQDEPFVPFGMYMVREKEMPAVKAAGFNLVQHYGADGALDPEETRTWLRTAETNGLRAFTAFHRGRLQAGDLEFVAERVGALMGEPALLAWYLFDEPELAKHGLRAHELARVKRLISALDPFHPVLLTCYHESYLDEYRECYDAFLTQAYQPTAEGVLKEATATRKALLAAGRPGSVIVSNQLPYLSLDLFRIQVALAALHQDGFFVWGWIDDYMMKNRVKKPKLDERFATVTDDKALEEAFAKDLGAITDQFRTLAPMLTAKGQVELSDVDGVVVWRKKTADGEWVVFANPTNERKTIDLPGITVGRFVPPYGLVAQRLGR